MTLGTEAASVAGELMSGGDASIGSLRSQLTELVVQIAKRETNPYKKIIIYVIIKWYKHISKNSTRSMGFH